MIATVPSWPARPLFRRSLQIKERLAAASELFGMALEVVGLVVFVAVIGALPLLLDAMCG